MDTEAIDRWQSRAALHATLADPARLRIVDTLTLGDASPSELASMVSMPSNLLAHHLKALERAGLVTRTRSEGDRRRAYVRLIPGALAGLTATAVQTVARVLFVCTANSARSHLAAALWRRSSGVPAVSAGTHPVERIAPGAIEAANRHDLDLPLIRPHRVSEVRDDSDLVVTVCDRAHEELDVPVDVHWSVPDPVRLGTPQAFDQALTEIGRRVGNLAPVLAGALSTRAGPPASSVPTNH